MYSKLPVLPVRLKVWSFAGRCSRGLLFVRWPKTAFCCAFLLHMASLSEWQRSCEGCEELSEVARRTASACCFTSTHLLSPKSASLTWNRQPSAAAAAAPTAPAAARD
eukprot:GHRQ01023652.1.p3 GENE.GHRQ01023652.1~~GHRQ01023652.1.p3  ORF type:complete len:108 (-),score=23.68 GHRQ01023652.1:874-1197(-)